MNARLRVNVGSYDAAARFVAGCGLLVFANHGHAWGCAGFAVEFFAITGKVYSIEESTDLKTWTTIPFSTAAGAPAATTFRATSVDILPAFVTVPTVNARFYRLSVR